MRARRGLPPDAHRLARGVAGDPAATVFGIRQPDGTPGLTLESGDPFHVLLENRAGEDTIIHWHGQTPPWMQDGVADRFRPLLAAGKAGSTISPRARAPTGCIRTTGCRSSS